MTLVLLRDPFPDLDVPVTREVEVEVIDVPAPAPTPAVDPTLDVALVDETTLARLEPAPLPAPLPTKRTDRDRPRIATSTHETTGVVVGPTTGEPVQPVDPYATNPSGKNKYFDMRGHAPDLNLRRDFRDALDHVPAGTAPAPETEATGQLQPSGGGTYRSNQGVFTAKVDADGSVKLKDAKNLRLNFPDPRKIGKLPKAIGNGITNWYAQEDKIPTDPEREGLNKNRSSGGDTRPDHGQTATVPVAGGGFDLGDALMRKKGIDPYASKKLAYLDSTRDERVQIGTRYKQQQLAKSTQIVQKHLDQLWARQPDLAALKQALFELWDDCAEAGEPSVVEAGQAARKIVVGFIRAKLPAGGATAYTAAELVAFNRKRQSKTAFAPYGS
ncbi:MAG TPA: hypothetical protein VFQ53_27365 [Kofleriaceae bacterium]|nr:hypothetical protein [Kofleriaceae bacterium]